MQYHRLGQMLLLAGCCVFVEGLRGDDILERHRFTSKQYAGGIRRRQIGRIDKKNGKLEPTVARSCYEKEKLQDML